MKISYSPSNGIKWKDHELSWGSQRENVRKVINEEFEAHDQEIDLSVLYNGDSSYNVIEKKDVYEEIEGENTSVFFSYDVDEGLSEIELNENFEVNIAGITVKAGEPLPETLNKFMESGYDCEEIEFGNYLFQDLKITLASAEYMGGEGDGISYFYAAKDISHLLEEE